MIDQAGVSYVLKYGNSWFPYSTRRETHVRVATHLYATRYMVLIDTCCYQVVTKHAATILTNMAE